MAKRRRNAQRNAQGCKVCGRPDVGRGIAVHLKGEHGIAYEQYKKCFDGIESKKIVDRLETTGTTGSGAKHVVVHVLVRRFTVPVRP